MTSRTRRISLISSVVLLAVGVVVYLLLRPAEARSVSVDEAAGRMESSNEGDRADPSTSTPDELIPEAGVYRYTGTGTETLSKPATSSPQGPELPGTVTHLGDGCWRFRIDYSTKHHQSWDYCADGERLVERGGSAFQLLNIVVTDIEVSTETTCAPDTVALDLGAEPGTEIDQTCTATSTGSDEPVTSSGPVRFVGREPIDVDGAEVETLHYRRDRTLEGGGQRGTEALDVWFAADTGLPVRNERSVTLVTPSPLGELTYEENGSFELASLEPART